MSNLHNSLQDQAAALTILTEESPLSEKALNEFLASVEKRAFRMARISVGNDEDALDIVQETMLGLTRRYRRKTPDDWRLLFFRILSNAITDHHRRQQVKRRIFSFFTADIDDKDELPAENVDPLAEEGLRNALRDERLAKLETAIAALPGRQQQAFYLRCWEGFSTQETAHSMKCSEGSVKTHYSRALKSLQAKLEDLYHD